MPDRLPPELERVAELVPLAGPPLPELPSELRGRTLVAVDAAAAGGERARAPAPTRRRRWPLAVRLALPAAAAVVAALLLFTGSDERPGELEVRAQLSGRGGSAYVEVREIAIGRTITFRSDDLAILPKGEYYELWFVGPGDRPGRPNRISAGTFHPDAQGRSRLELTAAVDPAKYPVLAVTAEPGDGDPRPSDEEVLRYEP